MRLPYQSLVHISLVAVLCNSIWTDAKLIAPTSASSSLHVELDGSSSEIVGENVSHDIKDSMVPREQQQLQQQQQQQKIANLEREAYSLQPKDPRFRSIWLQIYQMNPRNFHATLNLGLLALSTPDVSERAKGIAFIERIFDPKEVEMPIPLPSLQGMSLAMLVGRYRWEQGDYDVAYHFMTLAYETSRALDIDNVCAETFLATALNPFPNSTDHADDMVHRYMDAAESFLKKYEFTKPRLDEKHLGVTVSGTSDDPYIFCTTNLFHLSFYHRANVARAAQLRHQIVARVWPQLEYTNVDVVPYWDGYHEKRCIEKGTTKIQLGIASGFLSPKSSVAADFSGMLQRLDRSIFKITYLHFCSKTSCATDDFVLAHSEDTILTFQWTQLDTMNGAWTLRFLKDVEALKLDILLYLDLTMSPHATRVAMARLAPVQATTHGHPMTSGISSIDYYISWGAAELPDAQTHYVEKLILLNASVPHQYYEKRHDDSGKSVVNGGMFKVLARRNSHAFKSIPDDGNWYTCMQKPHKLMPDMDKLLCGILRGDPLGRILLHKHDNDSVNRLLLSRLSETGCDLNRIHLLPEQPHHALLALYMISTVILDSYPAGGCTTTREVLELGKAVVTLPARLLGGRWSLAYYRILENEELNSHVVALNEDDYIQKALNLGTNQTLRQNVESLIAENLHKLYHQDSAVKSWETVLLDIAPVEQRDICESTANTRMDASAN
jgi:predicted O-linked N-acetylglucosamine transferase (SPINDLY family)